MRYDGEPGGIFKECIPVVVHGEIEDGELQGDRVEVKHSDEYVAVNDENLAAADAQVRANAGRRHVTRCDDAMIAASHQLGVRPRPACC